MGGLDLNQYKDEDERQDINPHRVQDLKDRLNGCAVDFLNYILPGGKVRGHEYIVGTLEGGDGRSTSINIAPGKVGVGSDFATGETTGDLIDVYCKARNVDFKTALSELESWLGMPTILKEIKNPKIISPLLPEGVDLSSIPTKNITIYKYQDYDLNTILTIKRVVHSTGAKDFYPEFPDGSRTIPDNFIRPLYNLPGINNSNKVIIVEGEKPADYLISLGLVATTNIGGANAPLEKTDCKPLEGKDIVLWPDNDDAGIQHQKRWFERLKKMNVGIIRLVQPPRNAGDKWDAADCEPRKVKQLLKVARIIHRPVDVMADEFLAKSYDESPPKREYLIEGGFALNSMSILAAEGGTGKSFMFLDLAVKVAYGTVMFDESFGGRVMKNGNVVYLSAEDGRPDIHERINMVDSASPPRRFKNSKYELRIIPIPSLGVTFPLFFIKDGQLIESLNWSKIREGILEMNDVALIILDPLSMLVHADVNADPAMGALVCAEFNRLAVETNSSVLVSHHFSKGNYDVEIDTPEQARQHVRGTTALVDSARNVFCIWRATKEQAEKSCSTLGVPYKRNIIFRGATVKSNYLTEDAIKILKRSETTGVLECIETDYDTSSTQEKTENLIIIEHAIEVAISDQVKKGRPFKKIIDTDVDKYTRNMISNSGRKISSIVQDLVDDKKLIKNDITGELDKTDGELAKKWREKGDV